MVMILSGFASIDNKNARMDISALSSAETVTSLTERHALGNMIAPRGAVAQLGERLNGIQEVASSILVSSTRQNTLK